MRDHFSLRGAWITLQLREIYLDLKAALFSVCYINISGVLIHYSNNSGKTKACSTDTGFCGKEGLKNIPVISFRYTGACV